MKTDPAPHVNSAEAEKPLSKDLNSGSEGNLGPKTLMCLLSWQVASLHHHHKREVPCLQSSIWWEPSVLLQVKDSSLFLPTPPIPLWQSKKRSTVWLFCCKRVSRLFPPSVFGFPVLHLECALALIWKQSWDVHITEHPLLTLLATTSNRTKLNLFSCWTWSCCPTSFLENNFLNTRQKALTSFAEENCVKQCIF